MDKTNYAQTLMHMIKGNLGTGVLAMPASFAHTGLYSALVGLPLLCMISTYCVHLLVKSSQHLEGKTKGLTFKYASLAKHAFKSGPVWFKQTSGLMCSLVDGTLLVTQIGVCCVYLVFVVENITSILSSYDIRVAKTWIFAGIFPIAILLSYIRTLKRLAIASGVANVLQAIGISIILEYLLRDIWSINLSERDKFKPFSSTALGFGSAMFAFEGISVVLPCYTRMKNSDRMSSWFGVINVSYGVLLVLYFVIGLCGFLKFGDKAGDSITLNLPPEPLYDVVRAIFASSVFLTYPLQFYVPNEIIWNWVKRNVLMMPEKISSDSLSVVRALEATLPSIKLSEKELQTSKQQQSEQGNKQANFTNNTTDKNTQMIATYPTAEQLDRYEYYCRTLIVILTFVLAMSVPKLNLLMDLIGSISGTALSLILPALIHMAAFWEDLRGMSKISMILIDSVIITFGVLAGISGTIFSAASIVKSFS